MIRYRTAILTAACAAALSVAAPAAADSRAERAAAGSEAKELFFCTTEQGKVLSVTENGDRLRYSFGSPGGRPELVFENPRAEVIARSPKWQGFGRYINRILVLENGGYRYDVYTALDRIDNDSESGVTVSRTGTDDGDSLRHISCDEDRPMRINMPPEVLE